MKPKRTLYGIDPGTTQSALIVWTSDGRISQIIDDNEKIRTLLRRQMTPCEVQDFHVYIEMIQCMGMAVGKETFQTVLWIGRFVEVLYDNAKGHHYSTLIPRNNVKHAMCGSSKAKDANIAQSVRDKVGEKGSKRAPGPTHGVSSHGWQALAVAVTGLELYEK